MLYLMFTLIVITQLNAYTHQHNMHNTWMTIKQQQFKYSTNTINIQKQTQTGTMMPSPKTIYFIRHARSAYNTAQKHLLQKLGQIQQKDLVMHDQVLKLKWDLALQDCDVSADVAQQQCKSCRQKMKDIKLDLIVVSPMRRALATCELSLSGHKSKAPVIVDPLFREIMESACDIGSRLRESMLLYPDFDYSLISNVDYWYLETLANEEDKNKLIQSLNIVQKGQENGQNIENVQGNIQDLSNNAKNAALSYLKALWQKRHKHPQAKLQALVSKQKQKSRLKELLQKYNTIAVVTHSETIKAFVGRKPNNCEIVVYRPEYLGLEVQDVPYELL